MEVKVTFEQEDKKAVITINHEVEGEDVIKTSLDLDLCNNGNPVESKGLVNVYASYADIFYRVLDLIFKGEFTEELVLLLKLSEINENTDFNTASGICH